MSGNTRFGQYLLFKKLAEDALGETYRAGRVEGTSVGDVVLLRIFDGAGIDSPRLLEGLRAAFDVHKAQGPGVTYAQEVGEVDGIPFAAYEYLPGRDLARLHAETGGGFDPLSEDHAVLIVERVAKGLALLRVSEPDASVHGFLVPQLVWVSNEGEAKLIGFEAGITLATMAQNSGVGETFGYYISPEVLAGAVPAPHDDAYSLGAILWHLLLGEPPSPVGGAFESQLQRATLAASGKPVPEGLARLLQRSLAPAAGRIGGAEQWHRELVGWMAESPSSTTTFDLAFFMHELFRDEIRREASEIEKEKAADLRPRTAPPPTEPTPAAPPAAAAPAATSLQPSPLQTREVTVGEDAFGPELTTATGPDAEEAPARSKTPLLLAAAALVLLIAAGALYLLSAGGEAELEATIAQAPPPPPPPRAPAIDLAATEAALDQLMTERQQQMEERLRGEYDDQIEALQRQLEEARTTPPPPTPAQPPPPAAAPPPTAPPVTPAAAPPPAPPPAASERAETPPATVERAPADAGAPASNKTDREGATAAGSSTSTATTGVGARADGTPEVGASPGETAAGRETDAASPPEEIAEIAEPTPPPAAAPPPPPPVVVTPPELVSRFEPSYPPRARALKREATVVVKVLVGKQGRVVDAQPVSPQPKGLGFDEAALEAARRTQYRPARRDGEPIEMWTTLVFSFRLQ